MNIKQRLIAFVVLTVMIALSIVVLASCNTNLTFAEPEYDVKDGDYVTVVRGKVQYKLIGDVPEGVSVSEDGRFSIAASAPYSSQVVLAAILEGKVLDTAICKIVVPTAEPTITFANLSEYITAGEQIRAVSNPAYAITYSLKDAVDGIVVNESTGKISYRGIVADSTPFTVVATAMGVSSERTFLTATSNFVTVVNSAEFSELGVGSNVTFTLDFGTNTSAEAMGVIDVEIANTHLAESQYAYNGDTHALTIKKEFLATLSSGDNTVFITTAKNTASATVKVAHFVRAAEDLAAIGQSKEGLSGNYVMVNDIDLTAYLSDKEDGWYPIGTYSESDDGISNTENVFSGHFDGNGHTVSGLVIARQSYKFTEGFNCGLFGFVSSNGIIENLGVESAVNKESAMNSYSGGLCGVNEGTITNCWTNVNVALINEHRVAGAFCGRNAGTIINCYSIGFVTAGKDLGAFCGWNMGEITDCYAIDDPNNEYLATHEYYKYSNRPEVLNFAGILNTPATRCVVYTSVADMIANADFSNWSGWLFDGNELPKLQSKTIG